MCHYKRLFYACRHYALGPRVLVCDAAAANGGKCNDYMFHPRNSIMSQEACDICEERDEMFSALRFRINAGFVDCKKTLKKWDKEDAKEGDVVVDKIKDEMDADAEDKLNESFEIVDVTTKHT